MFISIHCRATSIHITATGFMAGRDMLCDFYTQEGTSINRFL
ncbi:hypothetical protein [Lutimonas sp.]